MSSTEEQNPLDTIKQTIIRSYKQILAETCAPGSTFLFELRGTLGVKEDSPITHARDVKFSIKLIVETEVEGGDEE